MRGFKIALALVGCVFGSAVAVTGCVVLDSALTVRCIDHLTQTSTLATPNDDTATQFKINRCQLDNEACTDLCALVLEQSAVSEALTTCDVHFNGDTSVTVNAHFDRQTNNPGCQGGNTLTPGDDVSGTGGGGVGMGSGGGPVIFVDAAPFIPDAPVVVVPD